MNNTMNSTKQEYNHQDASVGLDAVNVFLLQSLPYTVDSDQELKQAQQPLVIAPRWDASISFLCLFLKQNRAWVDEMVLKHGSVLLRGFEISDGAEFQRSVQSYQPTLNCTYRGTSPRNIIPGTTHVFSAAEVPVYYPIAQHLEMSFLKAPPRQLYFGCIKAAKSAGGETAICDFRAVFKDLDPALKEKLLEKKLRYTRRQHRFGSRFTHDVSDQKGWPEIFGTTSMKEVEKICAADGEEMHWENGDTFVSSWESEAFQLHPVSKEPVWFNHSQVFHWSTFPAELLHAFKRTWEIRYLLHCIFVSVVCIIKYMILGHKMSLDITFGDGSPISFWEMEEIRNTIHKNMIYNRWRKGDILLLDNFSTSHGRQPTYDRGRKVVVSWSDPEVKANELVCLNDLDGIEARVSDAKAAMKLGEAEGSPGNPGSVSSNPQERTLTEVDLEILKGSLHERTLTDDDLPGMQGGTPRISARKSTTADASATSLISDPSFWKKEN